MAMLVAVAMYMQKPKYIFYTYIEFQIMRL